MAMVSTSKLNELVERKTSTINNMRARTKEIGARVLRTFEGGGTALALGIINGRAGKSPKVFGMPVEGVVGVVAGVASILGFGGEHSGNVSDGALFPYLYGKGLAIGTAWKTTSSGDVDEDMGQAA
jgi:hypothetical protein